MSLSLNQRSTIVDRIIPKTITSDVALVAVGVLLIALAAQVRIEMYPVPITGQTFAVLLVGTALGFRRGVTAVLTYVVLGALGLPIFQGGASGFAFGPTLGYLIGFIASAAVTGVLSERGFDKKWWQVGLSFVAGSAAIYVFALPWLSIFLGAVGQPNDLVSVLALGFAPFVLGDIVKAAAAAALLPAAWAGVKRISR